MPQSTQCLGCVHYQGPFNSGLHCDAFPHEKGKPIPEDIFTGLFDHRNAHEGDNGIRYKADETINVTDDDPTDMSNQPPL